MKTTNTIQEKVEALEDRAYEIIEDELNDLLWDLPERGFPGGRELYYQVMDAAWHDPCSPHAPARIREILADYEKYYDPTNACEIPCDLAAEAEDLLEELLDVLEEIQEVKK